MNDKSSSIHRLQVWQASYMGKYCNKIIRQKAEFPFLMQKSLPDCDFGEFQGEKDIAKRTDVIALPQGNHG